MRRSASQAPRAAPEGQARVLRTRRREPATRRQQRRDKRLVRDDEGGQRPSNHACVRLPGMLLSARRRSATRFSIGESTAAGRPMITRSVPRGAPSRACRYASRRRRFTRFLATEPRTCRLTANPARVTDPAPAPRQSTTSEGRSIRLPFWKIAWKSAPLVSRSRRGNRPVTRSTVSALSRAGASGPSGRPWSTSAPETRASSSAGAHSVETCVSWTRIPLSLLNRNSVGRGPGQVNSRSPLRRAFSLC